MQNENADQTTAIVEAGESRPITPSERILAPLLSVYRSSNDTHGSTVTLQAVRERILDGKRGLDEKTRYCNALVITDPPAYKIYKEKNLPAVTFSGTFPKGKRKAQHLIRHSGYITIDIDGLLPSQIPDLLAELAQMPHVVMAFISPSGKGIKVIVRVNPIPTNDIEHKGAYQACLDFFEDLADEYEFEVDTSGKDCSRLCYLAHDPLAIFHTESPAIDWDKDAWIQEQNERAARFEIEANKAYTGEADVKALDYIDPNDLDYNQWLSVITAGKAAGLSWQQVDAWSRRGGVRYTEGEVESRWSGLNLDVSWGAVVNLAKENGYKPPRRNHKPVKLHKKTDLECVIEPIEKARESLQQAFNSDKKIIGFRADTGIGKTFKGIQLYQIKGIGGFISTPTTDLAKEIEARLRSAGVIEFRYRGIDSDPDGQFPHEKACMLPDEYTAYAKSGRNPYKMLCLPTCPHLAECEQDGYLSQEAKAKAAQVVVAPHKDLLFNPLFRGTTNRLLPQNKEDMITIDDFGVFESFIEVKVTQARLEYLRDTWNDHPLGDFAKALLNACVVQNAPHTGITEILNTMSGTNRGAIMEDLASYRVVDRIYTRKEAQEITAHIGQSTEFIENLPKIETEDWNLLGQLEIFLSRYHHAAGAPITWEKDTLTFYLPPLPLYTEAKVLCMSATLNQTFFEKAFDHRQRKHGDVGFIDADDTEWHPDARVYQLRTNRNPRGTLLTAEKIKGTDGKERWHYTGFSATGQKEFDDTLAFVKANPQRPHALISYKWVIDTHASELEEAGIITGHFGGLVGLDTHFRRDTDTPIFLHILGAPEVPPYETEHRYQLLYGDRETPPNFTRNDTTGEYHDKDVQAVYEAGVKSELMQAIGRAGLVKNPSTVILRTSHDLPSVSHRDQTNHWDHVDWAAADNNLDTLREVVAQREAREVAEAEAIASGDVQATMEIKGVGKSQAYKDTKDTRPQRTANKKADRDAQVIGLHQQGGSLREIETATGIPRSTVSRIIKGGDHEVSQSSTPLYNSTYRAVEEWDTRGHPDAQCLDSETLHTQEPSVDPQKADRDAQVIALWDNGNGLNASEIERETGVPRATVNRILKPLKTGDQSSTPLYNSTYRAVEKWSPPTNTDTPCVTSEPLHTQEPSVDPQKTVPPIPDTDYSRLDLDTAKQELERCQQRKNYSGAAFLRKLIKNRESQSTPIKKGNSVDFYGLLTIPETELFAKINEINDTANDDASPERDIAIDALNNLSSLLEKRSGSRDDVQVAPGHLLTFGTMPDRDTGTPR